MEVRGLQGPGGDSCSLNQGLGVVLGRHAVRRPCISFREHGVSLWTQRLFRKLAAENRGPLGPGSHLWRWGVMLAFLV